MKKLSLVNFALFTAVVVVISCRQKPMPSAVPMQPSAGISDFLGDWTLGIKGGSTGWLQVKQSEGYADANLLWQGGSILPVPYIFMAGNTLIVGHDAQTVKRQRGYDGDSSSAMMYPDWLEVWKQGDSIAGYDLTPKTDGTGLDTLTFTGVKLPPPPPAPDLSSLKYGQPDTLFNGKDLTGWRPLNPNEKNPFSVQNGLLVKDAVQVPGQPWINYTEIRTDKVFKDFNLKLDINVGKECNSGIYLRGIYEVQVEQGHLDSGRKNLDSHNIGGIYSRIAPTVNAEKPAGSWQSFDITLCQRHVTVKLNGTTIIDNQPLDGPTGGAISPDVNAPGPLLLQGSEKGKVLFRNIVLTSIED